MKRIRSAQEPGAVAAAAMLVREGGLVAFPTETVYGLGANAMDPAAVARIFAAKERPSTNPLIVHVATIADARTLVAEWPAAAQTLAERFWPGPLTLVLRKAPVVPDAVTAGGETVGLRIPAHPVALALLKAAKLPVAAPSANRSEEVSPTTAEHVVESLGSGVDMILDGGPTEVGVESTVVDLTAKPPRVLRPGMVTRDMLVQAIGPIEEGAQESGVARSPGQLPRHYAPRAAVVLVPPGTARPEKGDGILRLPGAGRLLRDVEVVDMPCDAAGYAAALYAALRRLDARGVRRIFVETPPQGSAWTAIHDRLLRASTAPARSADE